MRRQISLIFLKVFVYIRLKRFPFLHLCSVHRKEFGMQMINAKSFEDHACTPHIIEGSVKKFTHLARSECQFL